MPGGQDEVKLVVKDLMDRGGLGFTYRLVVKPVETAFQLTLGDEEVAIPRGGTALVPVTVTRGGYNGPIVLDVLGIPAGSGVTVIPGTVPAGQTCGVVGLKADAGSTFDARDVQVVGRGDDGQTVRRRGRSCSRSRRSRRPASAWPGRSPATRGRSSASPRR